MDINHFFAIIPLMALLVMSIIWYTKGLLHLMTLAYAVILAYLAITNSWELLFFPICMGAGVIAALLFIYSMIQGEWL